jgi:hypothetical protein
MLDAGVCCSFPSKSYRDGPMVAVASVTERFQTIPIDSRQNIQDGASPLSAVELMMGYYRAARF